MKQTGQKHDDEAMQNIKTISSCFSMFCLVLSCLVLKRPILHSIGQQCWLIGISIGFGNGHGSCHRLSVWLVSLFLFCATIWSCWATVAGVFMYRLLVCKECFLRRCWIYRIRLSKEGLKEIILFSSLNVVWVLLTHQLTLVTIYQWRKHWFIINLLICARTFFFDSLMTCSRSTLDDKILLNRLSLIFSIFHFVPLFFALTASSTPLVFVQFKLNLNTEY